jgi:hypothetical protein
MKKHIKILVIRTDNLYLKLSLIFFIVSTACNQVYQYPPKSEIIEDESAGMNGGFEYTNSGLPVNWYFYTPTTVPDSDFEIMIDTSDFPEGKQSLKFIVRNCSPAGGWYSPGFCNQFPADPGGTFRVSFWIKNQGSYFYIKIGGINSSAGQYKTIVETNEEIDPWRNFEYNYVVPEGMNEIRFEVNILKPGVFWIDDIRINRV